MSESERVTVSRGRKSGRLLGGNEEGKEGQEGKR